MKKFLTIILVTISAATYGQTSMVNKTSEADSVYAYDDVDIKPTLKEGMESFYKEWNISATYPTEARRKGIEGKVILAVVINEKGEMTEPKVEKGLGYGCDEAAIEALLLTKSLWTPGIKDGRNVKVRIFLPFAFKLK